MRDRIKKWLVRILGAEGGYVNRDPKDDPGGETKWGISKRSYPHLNIKELSLEEASLIYERDFLSAFLGKGIPDGIIFQLFDFAVHSGIKKAAKSLQRELGVEPDGKIGRITATALSERSESDMVMLITASRIEFLVTLDNWLANSRGWSRRIAKNLRYGASIS